MATPVSDFRSSVRMLIGDDSPAGDYEYTDAQIDAAVVSAMRMGLGPADYALASGNTTIEPTVADGDPFAHIMVQAALLRIGGEETDWSMKTRGFYYSTRGGNRARLISDLGDVLRDARGDACAFASRQELEVWLVNWRGTSQLAAEEVSANGYFDPAEII